MKNKITIFLLLFFGVLVKAQETPKGSEKLPVFLACEKVATQDLEACFYSQLQDFVNHNFKMPLKLEQNDFKGSIIVLFEVNEQGVFNVQYVDAADELLVVECKRVFGELPKINPPTYDGQPTTAKYTLKFSVPLRANEIPSQPAKAVKSSKPGEKPLTELDTIKYQKFDNPQFKSHMNVPFSHSYYTKFDDEMNKVGVNNHTGSKPYSYAEVAKYYDFAAENKKIMKNKTSWWGRKLWNENMVEIQGEDYWLTLNPVVDLRVGKSNPSDLNYTYVNTRGIQFNGGLGKELNFSSTIYESQGQFADYYNQYAESIKPDGGNPAIIPGIGIAKQFKSTGYDLPSADAHLTYAPGKYITMDLGYGRNFIGDGYRSLLLSDSASPYPYFKLNATFWKIKYTNIYMWLKDVRTDVTVDKTYATKFATIHYLSLNITNRWNLGLFESTIWADQNNRGFDMNFANPILFMRPIELNASSRSGNELLGFTSKYKLGNKLNFYAQFLIDEFSSGDVFSGTKSWKNKFGYQIGAKYYDAFHIKNLLLQAELNRVRPYVYSHSDPLTNYGHENQSLGHPWGGNFQELVLIARYNHGRYFAESKFTVGVRGLDFDTAQNSYNYGSNIYKSYEDNRPYDTGVTVGQGNKTNVFIADIQTGYTINPMTNMKLFASLIYRNFDPTLNTATVFKQNTTWFSIGLRCDLFNWYYDY